MLFLAYNFLTFSTHLMVDDIECMWQIVGKLRDSDVAKVWVISVWEILTHPPFCFKALLLIFVEFPLG
jgi:hypothetical protein